MTEATEQEEFDEGKAHKEGKKKFRVKREQELRFMQKLMADPDGRAFCWRLLTEAKLFIWGHVPDSNLLHFDNGKRSLGGYLLEELLEAEPKAYTLMHNDIAIAASKEKGDKK